MAIFSDTTNPCPYGFFNDESDFQKEADSIVIFVKRKVQENYFFSSSVVSKLPRIRFNIMLLFLEQCFYDSVLFSPLYETGSLF